MSHKFQYENETKSSHKFYRYDANIGTKNLNTTITTTTTILQLSGICLVQPGWAGTRRNISHSHQKSKY